MSSFDYINRHPYWFGAFDVRLLDKSKPSSYYDYTTHPYDKVQQVTTSMVRSDFRNDQQLEFTILLLLQAYLIASK